MKVTISFTPEERDQAWKVREVLLQLLGRCRTHTSQIGERCMIYLVGTKGVLPYRLVFILLIASGAFLKLEAIWILADIVNGLMAIPNLIALLFLSGICVRETKKYMDHLKTGKPYEEYED